jgi:hypothetical protein
VVAVSSAHAAGAHSVVASGNRQAASFLPSQAPAHAPAPPQGLRLPTGAPCTGVHVPSWPPRLQAAHWPAHAALQQRPSTQKPLAHWLAAPQAAPGASLGTQAPAWHQAPAAQASSARHAVLHAAGPQAKRSQDWVWGGGQAPAPSQEAADVAVPPVQEAARHPAVG